MSTSNLKNGANKRQRVLRACDSCRMKKAKCDSSLPCANCTQRDIPCIRRNGRKHISKSHELLDTLTRAVHILYQASKVGTEPAEVEDVTTHAILESLGLIEQLETGSDLRTALEVTSTESDAGPKISSTSSPRRKSTISNDSPRSETISSILCQTTCNDWDLPQPDGCCRVEVQTLGMEASSTGTSSWQSLSTPTRSNDFQILGPYHSTPSLSESLLMEEIGLLDSTWITDTDAETCFSGDVAFAASNSYHEPVGESKLISRKEPTRGDFDFDPLLPFPESSFVENKEVETINGWPVFEQYLAHGRDRNHSASSISSPCASGGADAHLLRECDLSTISTDCSSHSVTSPRQKADTQKTSELSSPVPIQTRKARRSKLGRPNEPTHLDTVNERGSHKRGHEKINHSVHGRLHATESEKRRIGLEKNRYAALQYREKRRREIDRLRETSHKASAENDLLEQQTRQMQEEAEKLRVELLAHIAQLGCCRPEEIKKMLDSCLLVQDVRE